MGRGKERRQQRERERERGSTEKYGGVRDRDKERVNLEIRREGVRDRKREG